jgi:hypothetical protein
MDEWLMSGYTGSYEDEDDTGEQIMDYVKNFQRAMASIPVQTKLVSDLSTMQANRLSKEMDRLRPNRSRRRTNNNLPDVHAPSVVPRRQAGRSQRRRRNTGFEMFVGHRRKVKDGMSLLTGR